MENTAMEPNEYLHALRYAIVPYPGQSGDANDPLIDDNEIERLQQQGANDRSESDVRIEHARKIAAIRTELVARISNRKGSKRRPDGAF